jgi:hypothetical protein
MVTALIQARETRPLFRGAKRTGHPNVNTQTPIRFPAPRTRVGERFTVLLAASTNLDTTPLPAFRVFGVHDDRTEVQGCVVVVGRVFRCVDMPTWLDIVHDEAGQCPVG